MLMFCTVRGLFTASESVSRDAFRPMSRASISSISESSQKPSTGVRFDKNDYEGGAYAVSIRKAIPISPSSHRATGRIAWRNISSRWRNEDALGLMRGRVRASLERARDSGRSLHRDGRPVRARSMSVSYCVCPSAETAPQQTVEQRRQAFRLIVSSSHGPLDAGVLTEQPLRHTHQNSRRGILQSRNACPSRRKTCCSITAVTE